ncbi:oligosaccharide flippase family protein [Paenibacillus chungangensis]|uniref:Oligosaccharide flippase family protein n=1 Tax=Paenibacillus chungangensis TaxID=696535 RepID=A0ABW3HX65_9BACL
MGRKRKRTGRHWWRNGVVLMAGAALVSKLIGVLQKVPLQNMAGDRVFGIYNAVYPFYQLMAVLATAGVPTAVSIIIAQRLRKGDVPDKVSLTLRAALWMLGITGLLAFAFMWGSVSNTAVWIGDKAVETSLRTLSVALLFMPVVAVLRGYWQGLGRMSISAGSQLMEQLVRVSVMLLVLILGLRASWDDGAIAGGVMLGSAAGAASVLIVYSLIRGRRSDRARLLVKAELRRERTPLGVMLREMREVAVLALPAALAAIVIPMASVVDAFTVPTMLQQAGIGDAAAMHQFGVYSRAQPLLQLVVMVAGAVGAALAPGLSAARTYGESRILHERLSLLIRLAWACGAAAALGLVLLAEPLNVMFYKDAQGTRAFAIVGFTALAGCVSAVIAPALQSLGAVRIPAALLLVAALLKGALNAVLVPSLGIEGAAFSGVVALSVAALLGAAALGRAAAAYAPPGDGVRRAGRGRAAAMALAVMAASVIVTERALGAALGDALPPRAAAAALALTGVAVGACAFAAAGLRCGMISAQELRALTGGEAWAARLRRWRLLPRAER